MFWRQMGVKVLLLHSYRDGEGKVRQRRLAHFDGPDDFKAALSADRWSEWQRHVSATFPNLRVDWETLRSKAQELSGGLGQRKQREVRHRGGASRTRVSGPAPIGEPRSLEAHQPVPGEPGRLLRRLARCIARERNPVLRKRLAAELGDLRAQCLGDVRPGLEDAEQLIREGRLEAGLSLLEQVVRQHGPGSAVPQRARALELLAEVLQRLDRRESAAAAWRERVRCSPDSGALAEYGAALQRLGRRDEAARQYRRLPRRDHRRHFNLASVSWENGDRQEALEALLQGLLRDRQVGEQLGSVQKGRPVGHYWRCYADLWSSDARRFFEAVYKQPAVRFTLRRMEERGVRPRQLLPAPTRAMLLERCLQ